MKVERGGGRLVEVQGRAESRRARPAAWRAPGP
jgi:hypothetical protein